MEFIAKMASMSTCKIIRRNRSEGFHGKQGLDYFSGISAETAGAEAICLHLLAMPPGAEAKPHRVGRTGTQADVDDAVENRVALGRQGSSLIHVCLTAKPEDWTLLAAWSN